MDDNYVYSPMPDQSLGIMRVMNPFAPVDHPVVDRLIPSDYFDPVTNMGPYTMSPQVAPALSPTMHGLDSVQDAMAVLSVTDLLFGG